MSEPANIWFEAQPEFNRIVCHHVDSYVRSQHYTKTGIHPAPDYLSKAARESFEAALDVMGWEWNRLP